MSEQLKAVLSAYFKYLYFLFIFHSGCFLEPHNFELATQLYSITQLSVFSSFFIEFSLTFICRSLAEQCLQIAEIVYRNKALNLSFTALIIMTYIFGYINKLNCHILSKNNPKAAVEIPIHPQKIIVWCASWTGGKDDGHD